jgi:hypothetical protein
VLTAVARLVAESRSVRDVVTGLTAILRRRRSVRGAARAPLRSGGIVRALFSRPVGFAQCHRTTHRRRACALTDEAVGDARSRLVCTRPAGSAGPRSTVADVDDRRRLHHRTSGAGRRVSPTFLRWRFRAPPCRSANRSGASASRASAAFSTRWRSHWTSDRSSVRCPTSCAVVCRTTCWRSPPGRPTAASLRLYALGGAQLDEPEYWAPMMLTPFDSHPAPARCLHRQGRRQ